MRWNALARNPPRVWRCERVRAFARSVGIDDPVQAAKRRSAELAQGVPGPPFDLDCVQIRSAANIKSVTYLPKLPVHGRVSWQDGSYVIEISSVLGAERRAFTLGHEVGHVILVADDLRSQVDGLAATRCPIGDCDEEEYLCDVVAAELLMPAGEFRKQLYAYGPSVRSILVLAAAFGTSLSATARRFAELSPWKCHIGLWRAAGSGSVAFEVGFRSRGVRLAIPRGFVAPSKSAVTHAVKRRARIQGVSDIGLVHPTGEPFGPVFVQAEFLSTTKRLLTVSILEKHPSSLCSIMDVRATQEQLYSKRQISFRFGGSSN